MEQNASLYCGCLYEMSRPSHAGSNSSSSGLWAEEYFFAPAIPRKVATWRICFTYLYVCVANKYSFLILRKACARRVTRLLLMCSLTWCVLTRLEQGTRLLFLHLLYLHYMCVCIYISSKALGKKGSRASSVGPNLMAQKSPLFFIVLAQEFFFYLVAWLALRKGHTSATAFLIIIYNKPLFYYY